MGSDVSPFWRPTDYGGQSHELACDECQPQLWGIDVWQPFVVSCVFLQSFRLGSSGHLCTGGDIAWLVVSQLFVDFNPFP